MKTYYEPSFSISPLSITDRHDSPHGKAYHRQRGFQPDATLRIIIIMREKPAEIRFHVPA